MSHETVAPGCTEIGANIYTCTVCGDSYTESIAKTSHKDGNGEGYCDTCGTDIGSASANCTHLCHKGGFLGFIWKIVNFFNKLFKINQNCECGAKHW